MSTLEERFWSKVTKHTDGCWHWTAAKNSHGYGQFAIKRRVKPAHRVAYEWAHGPIPSGLGLDHTCHNNSDCPGGDTCPHRACVNPAHLEPVTQKVNQNRGKRHAGPRKTHCPRGHEYTPENTYTRFNNKGGTSRTCRACERQRMANLRSK